MWKLAGALLAGSVLAANAATPPGASFAPTCKAGEVTQTRAEPAWTRASFANDGCVAPAQPPSVNGAIASRETIVAAMAAKKKYDALAGAYQRCIHIFVDARQAGAQKAGQRVNVALLLMENHRIAASRAAMQSVAQRTDLAVNQFNEYGSSCPD